MSFLRKRLAGDEKGFTLIELLVVVIIIGILMAIAIPSYLSFKGKANDAAAKSNVAAAIPVAEEYASNNNGDYSGMTLTNLQTLEPGVKNITVVSAGTDTYCLESTEGSPNYYYHGGSGATAATDNVVTTTACT